MILIDLPLIGVKFNTSIALVAETKKNGIGSKFNGNELQVENLNKQTKRCNHIAKKSVKRISSKFTQTSVHYFSLTFGW